MLHTCRQKSGGMGEHSGSSFDRNHHPSCTVLLMPFCDLDGFAGEANPQLVAARVHDYSFCHAFFLRYARILALSVAGCRCCLVFFCCSGLAMARSVGDGGCQAVRLFRVRTGWCGLRMDFQCSQPPCTFVCKRSFPGQTKEGTAVFAFCTVSFRRICMLAQHGSRVLVRQLS